MTIYWEKQNLIVLILKYTEEPYNLSLDVRKAFPGFEAGVSSTLISIALFLQEHKEVCDLSSQKLSRKNTKSQQHFNSITHKAWTLILNLQNPWKILGANIRRWANFPWFFQKNDSPISIFL